MAQNLIALTAGLLFGLGLSFSQMIDPQRVIGFLDFFGTWDPTLTFVLGGAVLVTLISFRLILRRPTPLLSRKFFLPTRNDIDRPLVLGAALFGIGWGLGGYCPGPAIAALGLGSANPLLFIAAMVVGSLAHKAFTRRSQT
ncbi:MAG: YeeE/YedE family protein [Leptolyngbya sp. DLM2.Bin27]|nr:MAG: YeeE/YedE family protein [Leptolyngbya sp. DLM2.Bin27]